MLDALYGERKLDGWWYWWMNICSISVRCVEVLFGNEVRPATTIISNGSDNILDGPVGCWVGFQGVFSLRPEPSSFGFIIGRVAGVSM